MRHRRVVSAACVRAATLAALIPAAVLACASHRVLVPPRLDLTPYGKLGLVTFTVENARGTLNEYATQRFEEAVLAAQSGFEVLELGSADSVLRRTGQAELNAAAAESLGVQRDIPAVFFGHLRISNVQPRGGLLGLAGVFVNATVSAQLSVQLVDAKSGGTIWRSSAAASEEVGSVSITGGVPYFSAHDPNAAYGRLVNRLVTAVTRDFRSTWAQQ